MVQRENDEVSGGKNINSWRVCIKAISESLQLHGKEKRRREAKRKKVTSYEALQPSQIRGQREAGQLQSWLSPTAGLLVRGGGGKGLLTGGKPVPENVCLLLYYYDFLSQLKM